MPKPSFVPAAHWHFLTPLYGKVMEWRFGRRYREVAGLVRLKPGESLLDIGCGPGNFLKDLQRLHPSNELQGIDIDPRILEIARRDLPAGVRLTESSATALPFEDGRFDAAVSMLMIHHLDENEKPAMVREAFRALKPGGRFYLLDFARPKTRLSAFLLKLFGRFENLGDAIAGKYPLFMREAGFEKIESVYRPNSLMEMFYGEKPAYPASDSTASSATGS